MRGSARFLAALGLAAAVSGAPAAHADAGAAPAGCAGSPAAGGERTVRVGDAERRAVVRLPAGYDGREALPVVIAFHGFTANARSMELVTDFSRAWPEAIVVYAQGLHRQIRRVGKERGPGWQLVPGELGDRDLAFFDALRAMLFERYCIDEKRLYLVGASNGAFFTHVLGCSRPHAIAGIASSMGGFACMPPTPVPVLLSHGRTDGLVRFRTALRAAREWANRNGCAARRGDLPDGCTDYQGCGTPLVFCAHGGGHVVDPAFPEQAASFFRRLEKR
ncbi:MAG: alpha/beta hydrolase family esterase [Candidatus Binatia bacterium]